MNINIAGISLYRHSIPSTDIRPSFEESVTWDLDAINKTKSSIIRFGEVAAVDQLELTDGELDFQTNLFNLYEHSASIHRFLGEMNLYSNGTLSNSYAANYLLQRLGGGEADAIWIKPDASALIINKSKSDEEHKVIDLRSVLTEKEFELLEYQLAQVRELSLHRNHALANADECIKIAEQRFIVGMMMDRMSVNYDAVDDASAALGKMSYFELSDIQPLPSALEFKDAFANPRKYLDQNTSITITENSGLVTIIVSPPGKVYAGFNKSNMAGLTDAEKEAVKNQLNDSLIRQVLETEPLSAARSDSIKRENLSLLSKNFSAGYKVVASPTAVVVTPFGEDRDLISKRVALLMLKNIKENKPDLYASLNEHCQAVSATQSGLDPRIALALSYELDESTETIFSDYPVGKAVRESIEIYDALGDSMREMPKMAKAYSAQFG